MECNGNFRTSISSLNSLCKTRRNTIPEQIQAALVSSQPLESTPISAFKFNSKLYWISIFNIKFSCSCDSYKVVSIESKTCDSNENIFWHKSRPPPRPLQGRREKVKTVFTFSTTEESKKWKMRYIKSICCFPLHKSSPPSAGWKCKDTRGSHLIVPSPSSYFLSPWKCKPSFVSWNLYDTFKIEKI